MKRYSKICSFCRSDGRGQETIPLHKDIPVRTNVYRSGKKESSIQKDEVRDGATLNFKKTMDNLTMTHA